MFFSRIKSGYRYGLAYLVVCVLCTVLIVIGNDLLAASSYRGFLSDTILQLSYTQWLPVCAVVLSLAFLCYLLLYRFLLHRFPLWVAALSCGIICALAALLTGISPLSWAGYNWYEVKNLIAFSTTGLVFVYFAELMD